ncbi:MAG: hypothetical protein WAS33_30515 [Candidatus Promineifilaceae bacterium]
MNSKLSKVAAILAWIIGVMAVVAGGRVLLGTLPDYYVIDWLPIYNFTVGVVTLLLTAVLIWRNSRLALPAAVATLTTHILIMLVLQAAYREVVARDSLVAMTVRITTWVIILMLMVATRKKQLSSQYS